MVGFETQNSFQIPYPIHYQTNVALGQRNNNIYFTTDLGLIEWNQANNSTQILSPEITYAKRIFSTENDLWLSHSGQGLTRIHFSKSGGKTEVFKYLENVVCSGFIEDTEGNFWITTLGDGVFFIPANAEKIKHFSAGNGISRNMVTSVFIDDEDAIWVGYQSNEIEKIEKNKPNKLYKLTGSKHNFLHRILDIDLTTKNRNLVLITDEGLYQKEGETFRQIIRHTGKSLSCGPLDEVLATTAKGTFLFNEKDIDSIDYVNPIKDTLNSKITTLSKERSYASLWDSKNWIWLGDVTGLKTITPSNTINWSNHSGIFNALITDIVETKDGLIWVATHGEGLVVFKDTSFVKINMEVGLSSGICTALSADESGIWIGTNRGINYIHSFDFESQKVGINIIGLSEGLLTNEIKDIYKKGDTIVVGTNKGISILSKKELTQNETPPKILIKKIRINDRDTTLLNWFDLYSYQNNIHFEFVGLSFRTMNHITYQYKLEGLSDEWKTTKTLETSYNTLPSGAYDFYVKAIINGEIESETKKIHFHIHPHFTERWWFITLCTILGSVLIFYFYYSINVYLQRKNLQHIVKTQTAELSRRLHELTLSNEKLEDVNSDLQKFAYVVSHDLKAPLRAISSLATFLEEDMIDRMQTDEKENMTLLKGRIKRMEALINGILEYSRIGRKNMKKEPINLQKVLPEIIQTIEESNKKKTKITIQNQLPVLTTNLTSVKQVFLNLISNAVKYNNKEVCEIEVSYEFKNHMHQFKIKDNGPGIPKRFQERVFQIFQTLNPRDEIESTGIGLSIVQKIVKEIGHGDIWIVSEEQNGSSFYFTWKK